MSLSFPMSDFQKETLLPWSARALPLKSRFWAQKVNGMYIFYLAFYKKRGVFGGKKKRVCSPRPAPTIQSSLLHSTKPKESFRGRVCRHLGGRSGVTDTGRWQLIRKWSKVPSPLKKQQQNQTEKKKKRQKIIPEREGVHPSLTEVKTATNQNWWWGWGVDPL